MPADLQELEAKIGYTFRDRDLLVRAVTHRSYSSETKPSRFQPDNEQLEFFGDAILGFLVSERLVALHPDLPEGRLSFAKSYLVSSKWLFEVATRLGLGQFLNLGRSEEKSGGRGKKSVVADAMEALIAALYLDGGIDEARGFVAAHVYQEPLHMSFHGSHSNFKGELWELAGAQGLPAPEYVVMEETGPHHQRQFVVEARLGSTWKGRGEGSTKKAAEQAAAREILIQLVDVSATLP
jgi:ribonuclease-3